MTEEKIFNTDDKAASLKTVTGWVSRHGLFYGDNENIARLNGCTHLVCDCGNEYEKGRMCLSCRNIKEVERYDAREFKEWDGKTPLYSEAIDRYFFDSSELDHYTLDEEIPLEDLRLVICDPVYPCLISQDIWEDKFPEGQYLEDVCPELADLLEALNKYIRENKPVFSWYPGKFKTSYKIGE